MKKDWGKGIPQYLESDLMSEAELLNFAMEIVRAYELDENGYQILAASDKIDSIPNFVVQKDGVVAMILVQASVAPDMPTLNEDLRSKFLNHAIQYNATCFYAPVGFGACDAERFEASLALRGDAFYSNYKGLEAVK